MLSASSVKLAVPLEILFYVKAAVPLVLLTLFWCWETIWPFFVPRPGRCKHAIYNLAIALLNTVVLAVLFSTATVLLAAWTEDNQTGLLNLLGVASFARFALALVLLDGWMYVWHRANHAIPLLWRFHRMHHSDRQMDVTTATRFHLGEHVGAALMRLGLIPLIGFDIWNLVVYDILVIAMTQFHHANISIGRWDRWLRWVIVTPDMHKVHHSDWRFETDANFSTVLSGWDRLARTFRQRSDLRTLVFGLQEFTDAEWQTWWGMMKTPFVNSTLQAAQSFNRETHCGDRENLSAAPGTEA